jgi:hypothetical protein
MNSTWRVIAVLAVLPLPLTACTGSTTAETGTEGVGSSSTESLADPAGGAAGQPLSATEKVVNEPNARRDVTVEGCSSRDGGWQAKGKIKNSGDKVAAYTVVVSFTNAASTVLARTTERVTVPAGKARTWDASARFKAPKSVVCVLRGVDRN